ncbi:serpentine type 7TM GPCR chemoreceptor srv domain-containing protein [Ditylenchus destructor]|uniref:Serpentine type 7TM GPCR chemoreceptor srv domain-containing protein n=1 Tax=Ditylenchus destructor TaxID=166010 RepID=A0AAD4MLY9_9BILA|nr:serpentine type 7TM GPCR chemoreceptor srv domain-containing protein [Ditylenchus destructor]
MVCGGDIFLSAIDIPATIFHISMAVFLIYNIFKKSKRFCTGFYVLFATISLFDVIQIGMIYFALRIPSCGYFPTLYLNNHWLIWLMYIITTYIEFYQLFGHTLISVNRFAVLLLSDKYNRESITISVITTAMVISTLTAFVLDLLVVIKIRHRLLSSKLTSIALQNDIKLLFSSIVVFCAQLLLTLYYVAVSYSVLSEDIDIQIFAQQQYIWISDVMSLCGSFALFAISDTVRRSYLEFYGITTTRLTMVRKRRPINDTTIF